MANLIGLAVARHTKAPFDVRKEGLQSGGHPRMVLYTSTQYHSCHKKSAEVLGLGSEAIRFIPVNDQYQIDVDALRATIAADKAAGYLPFCVVATAGSIQTGAFDDLNALADICAEHDLWLHVDGAFGAMVILTAESKQLVRGIERADSLGFDMHKWGSLPFEIGCVLIQNGEAHYNTFADTPAYLAHTKRGAAGAEVWFFNYGLQTSRSFRALKVWMSMKAHGVEQYGNVIQMNIDQTRYLANLVDESPELERTAPAPLNIVCFRYVQPGLSSQALNALNEELLLRLQESGVVLVSSLTVNGKYSLRMGNVNHRSSYADFDVLVEIVIELGRELVKEQVLG